MTDLAGWLLQQIAGDEAAARAAYDEASDYRVVGSELAELHFVNWKPDRVLAECATKKAIVEFHVGSHECPSPEDNCGFWMPGMPDPDDDEGERLLPDCPTLRLLAQPYAGRPGFDPAWKVET